MRCGVTVQESIFKKLRSISFRIRSQEMSGDMLEDRKVSLLSE
jgi:hypothetical protein